MRKNLRKTIMAFLGGQLVALAALAWFSLCERGRSNGVHGCRLLNASRSGLRRLTTIRWW